MLDNRVEETGEAVEVSESHLDHLLFRAFNPDVEITSPTALKRLIYQYKIPEVDTLNAVERLAESGIIRQKLLDNLSEIHFTTLHFFYQRFRIQDMEMVMELFRPFTETVIRNAGMVLDNCDWVFASLCILSEAWDRNLFRIKKWGPTERYYYKMSASRKRRRLKEALEVMRKEAMKQASAVFS